MEQGAGAGRLAWVDVAKGLCIVLVVMMHSTLGTGEAMTPPDLAAAGLVSEGFVHHVVAFAKPFRIPDFFLLSGLFLGRVIDRDWRLFADRRVVHFAYFYLLWVVIQSLAKYGAITEGAGPGAFAQHLALALVEPYSTLWFIYLLAVFSVVTKLLRRVPWPLLLGAAAALQVVPVHTESYLLEEFCSRYVWFVVGYLFAERIFGFAARVRAHPRAALAGLGLWALVEGVLVFTPSGGTAHPTLASLPGLSLVLGGVGALAIVAGASLLTLAGGPVTAALRACGSRSIAIYLGFFLPMALTRTLIVKTGAITDVGWASLVVTLVAVLVPLGLERLVRHTRLSFLFRRPAAFHIVAERAPVRSGLAPQAAA
ncbi:MULTISPECIES: acyltransferase family protein [unclassified Methylobacterium]|uniref:acyltransferase family protein n=1 Tax=unclassified Methylobacterium TaxID=2615210 RepID=UPI0006F58B56|nr:MULTISPECIES: acyltransferase family protein [unclassified Methylobacterium]KQP32361.1 acyltransferase [Methylobacterium sp. Leaf100]KQP66147.1 acyltransferase [Methylobacterium sp. Leaf112]